jgi:hypothetical protein
MHHLLFGDIYNQELVYLILLTLITGMELYFMDFKHVDAFLTFAFLELMYLAFILRYQMQIQSLMSFLMKMKDLLMNFELYKIVQVDSFLGKVI